jgi:hypothetical protein
LCLSKLLFWVLAYSHSSHLYGFYPVCFLLCLSK